MGEKPSSRILSLKEQSLENFPYYNWELLERALASHVVFITKKRKVVAHATWTKEGLVVTKIRRPNATKLELGKILYENPRQAEPQPPCPEIKTEGWQLIRYNAYDSSQAARPDPHWQQYEGWFMIPKTLDEERGLDAFLRDYPEMHAQGQEPKYTLMPDTDESADQTDWKMSRFSEVDTFVCGRTETIPTLLPFKPPAGNEMVRFRASLCFCGCGKFEGWHRYWENKWIVYVPRKK